MSKLVLTGLLFVFLGGCQEGAPEKKEQKEDSRREESERPRGHISDLEWGDLSCQRAGACANSILNLKHHRLISFLEDLRVASPPSVRSDKYAKAFACGQLLVARWHEVFEGERAIHDQQGREARQLFALAVDPASCQLQGSAQEIIFAYFITTKEYQNEIQ